MPTAQESTKEIVGKESSRESITLREKIRTLESKIEEAIESDRIPTRFIIPMDREIKRYSQNSDSSPESSFFTGREFIKTGDDGKRYLAESATSFVPGYPRESLCN